MYKGVKSNQMPVKPSFGSWNMKSIKFSKACNLASWGCIYFAQGREVFEDEKHFERCLDLLRKKLDEMGIPANLPLFTRRVGLDPRLPYDEQVDRCISEAMSRRPQLILTVLPFSDGVLYNAIKKACDIRYGVRNINVLANKFSKRDDQYCANVGLKFNLKLGGTNQALNPSELGIISQGKTMLVGIDVTHPSPGSSSAAPSVAGMVASIDSSLAQWPAELCVQRSRQEMVDDLDTMLKKHLKRWASGHKNALPENLIVYRDGVSEGQYDMVIDRELPPAPQGMQGDLSGHRYR